MTPTQNDYMIAIAANVEVLGVRAAEAAKEFTGLCRQLRGAAAQCIRALSRADRSEYWRLRNSGLAIFDALKMIDTGEEHEPLTGQGSMSH